MSARRPQSVVPHLVFLKENGHDLAPLTGTDLKALAAIAASWELYGYTTSPFVLFAIAHLVSQMQVKSRPLARELIAFAMDWSDRDRLWPQIERLLDRSDAP